MQSYKKNTQFSLRLRSIKRIFFYQTQKKNSLHATRSKDPIHTDRDTNTFIFFSYIVIYKQNKIGNIEWVWYGSIEYALHSITEKSYWFLTKFFFPDEFSFSRFRLLSKIFIELYQTFFCETLVSWMVCYNIYTSTI